MLTTVSLLSLIWIASPSIISDVTSTREAGRLVVEISADAMVDPEAASAKISDGRIYLMVGDTRVRADNRAWGEGPAQIRAHRHRREVELVIPMGEDGNCLGPVEFSKAAGGLRALIACEGATAGARAQAGSVRARVKAAPPASTVTAETPTAGTDVPLTPPVVARKADSDRDSKELRAALGLAGTPAKIAEPELEAPPPAATAKVAAPVATPPVLVAVPVVDKPTDKPADNPAVAPVAPVVVPAVAAAATPSRVIAEPKAEAAPAKPASGGGPGVYVAGFLLLGLGGAAYHFARKRAALPRYVKIIETASLGPKRAIVVAQINGEMVILGTSEAGITVLQPRSEPLHAATPASAPVAAAAVAAPAASPTAPTDGILFEDESSGEIDTTRQPSLVEELADIPEPELDDFRAMPVQGGLLARLFRRGKPANESELKNFDDLLEDSVEDQELRQKLSMGIAGRVR